MDTLGQYSDLCRRLDRMLTAVADGEDFFDKTIGTQPELFMLEEDGMVEIVGFDWKKNGRFDSVRITQKGRELINRGGYSNFDKNWTPGLFNEY